jgi:Zn-dependent peptidase ImmA (M78 family)
VTLRRGFKTEASSLAQQVRNELGLKSIDPLDPLRLASHVEIPLIGLSDFRDEIPNPVRHFSEINTSEFSAVTVFDGTKRLIVYNDFHSKGRQANSITHEISHGILLHRPTPAFNDMGCRDVDKEVEEEASWLAGVLLVPEEATLYIVRQRMTLDQAAIKYGVSKQLVEWRIRMTGARTRVNRPSSYSRGRR